MKAGEVKWRCDIAVKELVPKNPMLERADGLQKSAGHSSTGATASLLDSPGITDLIELDNESRR